jgi:hypothetical protein
MRGIGERDETSILDEVRRAFGVVGFLLRAKAGSSTVPKRRKRRFGFARNDNVAGWRVPTLSQRARNGGASRTFSLTLRMARNDKVVAVVVFPPFRKERQMVGHPGNGFAKARNGGASRPYTNLQSEQFLRIEEDGDRAIVEEFDLHVLLEASGFAGKSGGADLTDEIFVEWAGNVRRSRRIKRRALAAADVPEDSELRYGEDAAADIGDAEVHLSVVIIENTEAGDFFGEVGSVGIRIG